MNDKIYFVTFETHEISTIYYYVFHCFAKNAKEAKQKAKEAWRAKGEKPHMFHIYAKRSSINNVDLLRVKNIMCMEIKGEKVLDRISLISAMTVHGKRKLYGTKKGWEE